jgi:TolB-like protein
VVHAETSARRGHELPAEDCRAQLSRILNSADFAATGREHRFLSYVVEETLAGCGDRIKAYSIAVGVFGRDVSFDPQTDPIVRIEAGHLRRSLERYYLTAGQNDPIVITVPKGGYVPSFALRPLAPVAPAEPVASVPVSAAVPSDRTRRSSLAWVLVALLVALAPIAWWWRAPAISATPEIPRLLVETFDDLTGTPASASLAKGLKQEVIGQLSKFRDLVVMEPGPAEADPTVPAPRFVLAGSVDLTADAFRLRVRVLNRADNSVLWADSYDGGMKVAELLEAQADIARNVATTLGQSYGIIFSADASLRVDNPPDDWAAYSCTLAVYAYWIVLDAETRSSVRHCLETTVDRFPGYATAWGLLSLVYSDEYRFQFSDDPALSKAALERALAAGRRAVELDPRNIRALHAQMIALYFNKEVDAALELGKKALALNPNDTELMGEYASRLSVSGNWHDGCALTAAARQRNPGTLGSSDVDLALCSYFTGDYPQAVMWIRKSTFPSNPVYHVVAAAVFGEAGLKSDAERESAWLSENAPALVKTMRQTVSARFARSQDVDLFIGSLEKAGLQIND